MLHYIKRYTFGVFVVILLIVTFFMLNRKEEQHQEVTLALNEEPSENPLEEEDPQQAMQTEVVVNIEGAIKKPGVYTLDGESRVDDIVEVAGGFTKNADERQVNLAQRIYDEMFIYIPSKDEEGTEIPSSGNVANEPQTANKIRVNQATIEELETLNGIGTGKAEAIIQYIEEHGAFEQVDDLLQVSGIGEKTLDNFKDHIIIP